MGAIAKTNFKVPPHWFGRKKGRRGQESEGITLR